MHAGSLIIEDRVRILADPALQDEGIELVGVEFRSEPVGWVLRIFIDKPEGVGIADCQRVSEVIGTLIEVEDAVPHAYTLEVSSPGLTRNLQSKSDWARAVGRTIKVVTNAPVAGRQDLVGKLVELRDTALILDVDEEQVEVARDLIARARLEIEWPAVGRTKRASGANRRRNAGK